MEALQWLPAQPNSHRGFDGLTAEIIRQAAVFDQQVAACGALNICKSCPTQRAGIQYFEAAPPHVLMTFLAGCSCVVAAALRFLSVGGAIEARSIASNPARKGPAATGKGKLGDAIRLRPVVAPCTPKEIAVTVPECDP